jgi:acetyl-CoA acetyltransferase
MNLRGAAAIVGFGDSYADAEIKKSPLHLAAEATAYALADAGLEKDQLDGLLTGREPVGDSRFAWNTVFAAYTKLTPRYSTQSIIHGAGINSMLKHAALAVTTGVATHVLCVCADSTASTDPGKHLPEIDADPEFELPYGPSMPSLYAQIASRYMHEFGITEEHLARVAVSAQDWAVHHPYAAKAKYGRVTAETIMGSRMIASPLRLWHCAIWGPPGTGGAFIVTTAERARELTETPVYLLGFAECSTHEYVTDRLALRSSALPLGKLPNLTTTGTKVAAQEAFGMSGLGPWDMDLVMTASNFAHVPLMMLEDLGYCEKGEAGNFVADGHIDIDGGDLKLNTNGSWLSFGQPGISCVTDSLVEAVRQLRGIALGKQVEDVRFAVTQSVGGPTSGNSVTILGTEIP